MNRLYTTRLIYIPTRVRTLYIPAYLNAFSWITKVGMARYFWRWKKIREHINSVEQGHNIPTYFRRITLMSTMLS